MSAENFLLLRSELIDLMAKNLDVHLNIVWSSNGLLLAAIGWIITSKEARNYIGKSKNVWIISQLTLIILLASHIYLLNKTYQYSSDLYKSYLNTENVLQQAKSDGIDQRPEDTATKFSIKKDSFFYIIPQHVYYFRMAMFP